MDCPGAEKEAGGGKERQLEGISDKLSELPRELKCSQELFEEGKLSNQITSDSCKKENSCTATGQRQLLKLQVAQLEPVNLPGSDLSKKKIEEPDKASHKESGKESSQDRFAVASKAESDFIDLVYKAMRKLPGFGEDLEQKYSDAARAALSRIPFYEFDKAERLSPKNRDSASASDAIKAITSLKDFRTFINELKRLKEEAGGKLSESDIKLLNPLSNLQRKAYQLKKEQVERQEKLERSFQKQTQESEEVPLARSKDNQYFLEISEKRLEKEIEEKRAHLVHGMLSALLKEKPEQADFEKMAAYALINQWDNHNGGTQLERSKLLDSIYAEAKEQLSKEDFKLFEQKTLNYARAVKIQSALHNQFLHVMHSPDLITVRSILSTLDAENRKQVVAALEDLNQGKLQHELEKNLTAPQDLLSVEELIKRPAELDLPEQIMVGIKLLEKRLGLDANDTVSGFEWSGVKYIEAGILKRAALLDEQGWKKLEEQYRQTGKGELSKFTEAGGMPEAFVEFFKTLRESKGKFENYESMKKIIDAACRNGRFDLLNLSLQMMPEKLRRDFMTDQASNLKLYGKAQSTMERCIETFGKTVPSDYLDVSKMATNGDNRKQAILDLFNDGEISLLAQVKMNSSGLLHLNYPGYTRERELQIYSSDVDGIEALFANASATQKDKALNDPEYRNQLGKALKEAVSTRKAGIMLSELLGQEDMSAGLLKLRSPGLIWAAKSSDLSYKRFMEERLTDKDLYFWRQNLKNPDELQRLKSDLSIVYSKDEIDYIVETLEKKVAKPELSAAQIMSEGIGKRELSKEISEARLPADLVRALLKMSKSEISDLSKQKQQLQAIIEKRAKELSSSKAQSENLISFLNGYLDRVIAANAESQTNADSKEILDPLSLVKLSGGVNFGDPFLNLAAIEAAFDKVPGLAQRLNSDPKLKAEFEQCLKMAIHIANLNRVGDGGPLLVENEKHLGTASWKSFNRIRNSIADGMNAQELSSFERFKHVLNGEALKIDELIEFASGLAAQREVILSHAGPDEVKRLLEKSSDPKTIAWQEKVLGPKQHREVTESCLEKGHCDAADQSRIAALSHQRFSSNPVWNALLGLDRTFGPVLFYNNLPANPAIQAFSRLERSRIQPQMEAGFSRYQSISSLELQDRSSVGEKLSAQLALNQYASGPLESTLLAFSRREAARAPRWQWATDVILGGKAGIAVENANNALLKAMLELKNSNSDLISVLKEAAADSRTPRDLSAEIESKISAFENTLQNYASAENGIAARTRALVDILNVASVIAVYAGSTIAAYRSVTAPTSMHTALVHGKITAKLQMALCFWITSAALKENMDVEAAVKALAVFPFFQAHLPIVVNGGRGMLLGIEHTSKEIIEEATRQAAKELSKASVAGRVKDFAKKSLLYSALGGTVSASFYANDPFGPGASIGTGNSLEAASLPVQIREARKNNLEFEFLSRLKDL